jgi:hypothetical protein
MFNHSLVVVLTKRLNSIHNGQVCLSLNELAGINYFYLILILNLESSVYTICLPDFTFWNSLFCPRSVYVFRMVFIVNNDYFPEQH